MILNSLLDTDFYKLTMAQVVLHQYPATIVKYRFKCRSGKVFPHDDPEKNKEHLDLLKAEVDHLCTLRMTEDELEYLSDIPFFKADFIEYLHLLQLNRKYIRLEIADGDLRVTVKGPWISAIWFEAPVLAIISQAYYQALGEAPFDEGERRLKEKIAFLNSAIPADLLPRFKFADFGTRRRFSHVWQDRVIETLMAECPENFTGTSNVYLAKKRGIKPIGTMAHEFLQAHQQLGVRLVDSQKAALDAWVREYRGALGIALSDVATFDAFLRDFDLFFAKLFDGCRHDSGDPYVWCRRLMAHYRDLNLDPKLKTAVFSDNLTFQKMADLFMTFHDDIRVSFGIGTNLTNDLGPTPLNIVIKMVECNGRPVAKISDSKGKGMCEDEEFLNRMRLDFRIGG